ncbi:palmitoyltransferase ZDHHC18a isoform X1 [Nerophis lumbriciformis]|uniref:palmitoyltransferase ZDHHC18a isoform X1 n=1 Tax=Nerophis lumbriciformis TaxID=546530 RepID=UPI002ADF24F4|nr:palmitoyltransferase ZDHHC18-A-like isoform X1 [Nerophis lumbriciformis]XP_061807752.1 palmitoyltransferase ZDHHC18-A-like isoform X1 [Nerophis lumbriciformis]
MRNCEYQQIDPLALSVSPALAHNHTGKKAGRPRRKWEVFPGKNQFFCDGRIMFARQSGVLPLTLGLIVVTCGLFFAFDCPFLVQHLTFFIPVIGGVLFVFVVLSLLRTSFTDPGILPRATPDEAADIEKQIDTSGSSTYRPPPRTKEILINQQVVKLKYCFTCKMFRPPRTSHCSLCDNCVERFDHHCPWVGNCVGRRNYRFFYSFIISLSFLTSFIFGCVIAHITLRSQSGTSLIQSIQESPASVVELVICFFSIWSILGLSGFHTYLVASNLTTNEDIKGSWSSKRGAEESGNPYTYNSMLANCCVTLCGPMPPSLIDRRGFLSPEESVPAASASEIELPPFAAKNDKHMCSQSTKDVLERMLNSSDFHGLCFPGTPKTTPLGLEASSSAATPIQPSPTIGCLRATTANPCSPLAKSDSMHSINPAFRLASPSPSLGRTPLTVTGTADVGFIPLP